MKTIDDFLDLLKNVKKAGPGKWMACCPTHNDGQQPNHQSLSIKLESDKIILHCFAGCKTQDIVKTLGLTMSDLFLGEKKKKDSRSSNSPRRRRQIVKTYPYHNAGNQLLFEVVRYDPKGFAQRRPDGKGGYINNINRIERVIYRLPQILAAIGRGEVIYHCEGEKDADSLVALGLEATTTPMGAANWKPKQAEYYQGARLVVILPDNDPNGKTYAQEVACDISDRVTAVKILYLPNLKPKEDVSDWINAGGTAGDLNKLVLATPAWRRPPVEENLDYDTLKKQLKKESDGFYTISNQSFSRMVHPRDGGEDYPVSLCNFIAKLTGDIYKDSGASIHRFLRIRGRLNGASLPEITIPEEHFDGMSWVRREWGAKAQIEKSVDKVERHIGQAIIKSSGFIPEETIYTHTGWREIDGKMTYLTNGGGIGMPDIKVELTPQLARYRLPQPDGDPKIAIEKSFELLNVVELPVSVPTLILPYLAVLNIFEEIPFTAFYIGESGSYKSVLTGLALSHFGNFNHKTLPASWYGTKTELEKLSFYAKDTLFAIDDYAPPSDSREARDINNTIGYILRAYGNRQGKVRSNVDLTSQETFPPRGFLVTSGEHLPPAGVSRSARTLPIPVRKEDFQSGAVNEDYYLLSQAQKDAALYPVSMSHFIKWIIDNWDIVSSEFHRLFTDYRGKAAKKNVHLRLTESVALMQSAFCILLQFACDFKVKTEKEQAAAIKDSWDILQNLLTLQNTQISNEKPGTRFVEVLQSMLLSGRATLRRRTPGGEWTPAETAGSQALVGWDDGDDNTVFLNREESYTVVHDYCRRHGEFFGTHQPETWRNLMNLGYLSVDENADSPTILKKIDGVTIRVLPIKREVLYPSGSESNE